MKPFTQTNLEPGNCWQTCVASILEVDPAELPPQEHYDLFKLREDGTCEYLPGPSYNNILQAYLRKHHGMVYVEMHTPSELLAYLTVRAHVFHMLTGRTVRTARNGARHVVVGKGGVMVWDPHPSRVGLTEDIKWAFVIPIPAEWRVERGKPNPCVCPACSAPHSRTGENE